MQLDEVESRLPANHPKVTPEERAEALQLRDAGINLRRNPVDDPADDSAEDPEEPPTDVPGEEEQASSSAEETASESDGESSSSSDLAIILAVIAVPAAGVIGWLLGRRRKKAT